MSAPPPRTQSPPTHQSSPIPTERGPIAPQELWTQLSPLQQQQVRLILSSISQQWLSNADCCLIPEGPPDESDD